jgi:hypothetical protein
MEIQWIRMVLGVEASGIGITSGLAKSYGNSHLFDQISSHLLSFFTLDSKYHLIILLYSHQT